MKPKEITYKDKIKYKDRTERLGRAEFLFCPIFKYGRLNRLVIYRLQQESDESYYIDFSELGTKITSFNFTSWTHKGIDEPNIWLNQWCKEHKTISFRVYVPINTDTIEFEIFSSEILEIRFVGGDL